MTLTNRSSFVRALTLVAAVAMLAAPALARGGTRPNATLPDWFERYAAAHPFGSGAMDTTRAPDVLERYAAAHPFGSGVIDVAQAPDAIERYAVRNGSPVLLDRRSPDTRDVAETAQVQVVDLRSPDTRDAASKAEVRSGVRSTGFSSAGFDWGDAGIGAMAAALVLLLLLGSTVLLTRHRRRPGMPAI